MPILAFILSLVSGLALIPWVRRVSLKAGKVDAPRKDRWHQKPTTRMGGVGIFLAFAAGLAVVLVAGILRGEPPDFVEARWGILLGAFLIFLLGFYDDLKRMTPQAKLVGQILAATVVIFLGYTTNFFGPRIQDSLLAQIPNILLTYAWLVGITNAINLLDNMDGLAGGIALITAAFLSFFFWRSGDTSLLTISLALAGAVLAFLVYNFPPASIFMGDSGSLFLGFTLALLAIARHPQASNVFAVMGVPTLLFLLPILDTTLVTFTRLLRGQSPAQGGRDHTSHRLIAFGLSERQAVLTLYGVALVSGLAAATLESIQYWFSLVLAPVLVISLALLTAYLGRLRVVSAPSTGGGRGQAIARIMVELTYRRRLLEVGLDFFLIGLAYYLAFLARFGLNMNALRLDLFLQSLPLALAAAYIAFYVLGVYRGVWRYVGLDDLLRFGGAAAGSFVLMAAATAFLFPDEGYSPVLFALFAVFLFLGLTASRSSFRILDQVSGHQRQPEFERVLVIGAGDSGEMAVRWMQMNPQMRYRPVGFLDADPFLAGRQIHGVMVLGGLETLAGVLERREVDGLIIACGLEALEEGQLERLLESARTHGLWVRSLRLEFELVEAGS